MDKTDAEILSKMIARERKRDEAEYVEYRRNYMIRRYRRHSEPIAFEVIGIFLLCTTASCLVIMFRPFEAIGAFGMAIFLFSYVKKHHRQAARWLEAAFRNNPSAQPGERG